MHPTYAYVLIYTTKRLTRSLPYVSPASASVIQAFAKWSTSSWPSYGRAPASKFLRAGHQRSTRRPIVCQRSRKRRPLDSRKMLFDVGRGSSKGLPKVGLQLASSRALTGYLPCECQLHLG